MTSAERHVLVRRSLPRIDARQIYAGKSWAGCYIRDSDDHRWDRERAIDQYIDSQWLDSPDDIESYRRFLEGMLPQRSRLRGRNE